MADPLFSVVVPTYNRARRVAAAVRSALRQTDSDFECLVVDDGSRDDTRARLEAIRDPRLRCAFNAANRGQHACRNQAIRQARGEWIAFLDSDDLFLPRRLERVRAAIRGRPGAGFWFTNAYVHRYGRLIGTLFDPARPIPEGRLPGHYAVGDEHLPYVTTMVVLRRDAFLKTGFFREDLRLLEDTELYARMIGGGLEVGVVREPLAVRFLHDANITQDHRLGYVESLEALRSSGLSAGELERRRLALARECALYFWKDARPDAARAFLLAEAGPPARASALYAATFVPAPLLRLVRAARRAWLTARHHPLLKSANAREASRIVAALLED